MKREFFGFIVGILGILALQGCMTKVSDTIPKDGKMSQSQVTFPSPSSAWVKNGIYPSAESIKKISEGMDKDEIIYLIGHPHFAEGLYGVVEWDYLFHLAGESLCQYKIVFDKDYRARSFFWKPQTCAKLIESSVKNSETIGLQSDVLFDFGSYDLKPSGKEEIGKIATLITSKNITNLQIIGHTDKIGSERANLILSKNRAQSVKDRLVELGVKKEGIFVKGVGENQPVKECDTSLDKAALIKCLSPNRRVEIEVVAK